MANGRSFKFRISILGLVALLLASTQLLEAADDLKGGKRTRSSSPHSRSSTNTKAYEDLRKGKEGR
ncbi:hypothetical protein CRG98_033771 [Punica granatum]|uniref:Uncharacterized protein n=1 Tax=Punica granatum TaxID=22663 RepID=A0A2I0IP36_PUNGR|nr:hypothetical protein CRG98_033771 [Punica granatum]